MTINFNGSELPLPFYDFNVKPITNRKLVRYKPPRINSWQIPNGTGALDTAGGFITLAGEQFGALLGTTTATLGGVNAPVVSASHTSMTLAAPAGEGIGNQLQICVGGQLPVNSNIFLNYAPPSLGGLSPNQLPTAGGQVVISGSNFGLAPTVDLGGVSLNIVSASHTQLIVDIPPGTGRNLPVRVTAAGQISNSLPFSYAAPTVSSISPTTGSTTGGTLVTLQGSNFGTDRKAVSVTFDQAQASVVSSSYSEIVLRTPAGQGTGVPVTVSVSGQTTDPVFFSYNPPQITSVFAYAGMWTSGITPLIIRGENFGTSPQVFIGGSEVTVSSAHDTQLYTMLPPGVGTTDVVVTAAGQSSKPYLISYIPAAIHSFSPGSGSALGETTVTIFGTNFGQSGASVDFGDTPATVLSQSHTVITCRAPAGNGSVPILVTVGDKTTTAPEPYIYEEPGNPVITAVSAPSYPTSGGVPLEISGMFFEEDPIVTIGGIVATVNSSDTTSISCTLPPGSGQNLNVVVNSGGKLSNAVQISYDAPVLGSLEPATGPTIGGIQLTIQGSNFGTDTSVTQVLFGDQPLTPTLLSHSEITFTAPAGEGANIPVKVQVGNFVTASEFFSYAAPSINNVSGTPMSTAGGTTITVLGTNFGLAPVVNVDGQAARVLSSTHTSITAVVPEGSGTGKQLQVTSGGQPSNSVLVSYQAPTIVSVEPTFGSTAGGTPVTIYGTNLGSVSAGTQVTIDGAAAVVTSASHNKIECLSPAGQGTLLPVRVTVGGQMSAAGGPFSYSPPKLTDILGGPFGTAGGQTAMLIGSNFGTAPSVTIDGNAASLVNISHSMLQVTVPEGTGQANNVIVTAGGQKSSPLPLDYAPPQITSVNPTAAPTAGGVEIALSGSNFGTGETTPTVKIGGREATVIFTEHSNIMALLPPGEGTNQLVEVEVDGQKQTSEPVYFHYSAPTIANLSGSPLPTAGGTTMTLSGSNFGVNPQVTVGGKLARLVEVAHNQISFLLPEGAGTNLPVQVQAGNQMSNAATLSYDAPVIVNVSPSLGPTAGGTVLTLSGLNFGGGLGGVPEVTVGGTPAPLVPDTTTHTEVQCYLPEGAGSSLPVRVTVAGQISAPASFSYAPPALSLVEPRFVNSEGGSTITLLGSNFGPSGTPEVTVGGAAAGVAESLHTSATVIVPAGTGANQPVILTAAGQVSNAAAVTYVPHEEANISGDGDAPPTPANATGVIVDYADGSSGDGSSVTTVTVHRDAAEDLSGLPEGALADLYWVITTDRTFTSADLAFQYDPALLGLLRESTMQLYTAPTPNGPWTPVSNQTLAAESDTIYAVVSHFSWFALAGAPVPVSLSEFQLE